MEEPRGDEKKNNTVIKGKNREWEEQEKEK